MAGVEIVKVKSIDDGMRLNRWFLKYYPSLSMSRFQKLLRTKQIKVDGKRAEAGTKLMSGSEIRIPPLENEKAPLKKDFVSKKDSAWIQSMVVYKDDNILVINKPSGLAVQGGTGQNTSVDDLLDALTFEKEEKPRLTHRIDKDTSGLLVLGRNRKSTLELTKAFKEHTLAKTYLALCFGVPKNKTGEIKAPLLKVGDKMEVRDDGQKALTTYRVLDTVGSKFSLIEASPLTGRTHQIRAHLAYIGVPIVGDRKYGDKKFLIPSDLSKKLHLHAWKIDLSAVIKQKSVVKAELSDYLIKDIEFLGLQLK